MARYQLFCIPHAGASAAVYYRLRAPLAELAEVLPVELAGHGARMIRRIGGTDPAVLDNPELTRVFLPILRAGYQVAETFRLPDPGRVLNCPVTAFAGSTDGFVSEAELLRWSEFTTTSFSSQIFPGGHFYLFDGINRICRAISQALLGTGAAHPDDLFTR